jgi:hypothetical protein
MLQERAARNISVEQQRQERRAAKKDSDGEV